jgi:hypothetical protein
MNPKIKFFLKKFTLDFIAVFIIAITCNVFIYLVIMGYLIFLNKCQ